MVCACPNPNCKQMFKIDDSFAGKQATCPKCKKPFIIPKAPLEALDKQASPKIFPTAAQASISNTVLKPPPVRSSTPPIVSTITKPLSKDRNLGQYRHQFRSLLVKKCLFRRYPRNFHKVQCNRVRQYHTNQK
jgi:hypothetical protein